MTTELFEKEKILVETCVRMVLADLLEKNEVSQMDFEAILHNINVGCFGEREVDFDDISWVKQLETLRRILMKLSPTYEDGNETGDWYRLPEENYNGTESVEKEKRDRP